MADLPIVICDSLSYGCANCLVIAYSRCIYWCGISMHWVWSYYQHAVPLSTHSSCWCPTYLVSLCHVFIMTGKVSECTWIAHSNFSLLSMFSSTWEAGSLTQLNTLSTQKCIHSPYYIDIVS